MAISKEKKQLQVAKVQDLVDRSVAITVAENHGVTSNEMNQLRAEARANNVVLMIAKNKLSKRVLEKSETFSVLTEDLTKPVVLGFAFEELSASAKLLGNYAEKNKKLSVKSVAIEGIRYDADRLKYVMSLPSREQAISMVALGIQSPVVQFTGVLQELYGQFARVLHAVAEQKDN